jgi:serine/threonine protein kinase
VRVHQQHPKSGDVWALGCILSEVLAYAVAPHLVGELRVECEKPHNVDQRFYDVNKKEAKVTVMAWLRELPDRYQVRPSTPCSGQTAHPSNPSWVAGCVKLIESALVVNPTERCTAGSMRDRLGRIQKQMSKDHKFTLVERPKSRSGSPTIREHQSEEGTAWLSVESFGSPKNMEPPKW